ncbi:MAG: UdgX family uracil-DNA binding protein [Alphaproteobacteria bacterium]|nr:UdgX family uracil-DNA binding protein [Alphaproteobacteria bacterium]
MQTVVLKGRGDLAEWRDAARALLADGVDPAAVDWRCGDGAGLFGAAVPPAGAAGASVPRGFIELAAAVVCHRDPGRFALLYRLLVRLQGQRALLDLATDPDVVAARRLEKAVRRDSHKMKAFVRFNELPAAGPRRRFAAWFEPDHHIVARTAPFFARRFADMDWMILTPQGSAVFTDGALAVTDEPAARPDLADPTAALWLTYYASIFNPARVKVKAMQAEMPKKYWKNLPEAGLIADLLAQAPARVAAMATSEAAPAFHARLQARRAEAPAPPPPSSADTLASLRAAARGCTRCPLHGQATQTVFGEGPPRAALMIVGEQPGDREDLAGRPFVGPAGQVLDAALAAAGIDRAGIYVTNAVKHFKHELRGRRRLHRTPDMPEVEQCRWWLAREIALVAPRLVVAMGATALLALTGDRGRLADRRGRLLPLAPGRDLLVTVHPSYLLRLPDPAARAAETAAFHADLALAAATLAA